MTSIGLDFGTTYSVLAAPKNSDEGDYTPQPVMLYGQDSSPFYDSLALKEKNGTILYGRQARIKIGKNGTVSFKGFKLLLAEENPATLKERGFTSNITPENVVKGYINDLLMKYRTKYGNIDGLVVGIPEIWVESSARHICRERLYNLLKEVTDNLFPDSGTDVVLVSEPVCACAYYAEKYKQFNDNRIYEGNVLIVDYGGGTLDIALCSVKNIEGEPPKVSILKRAGAGANEEQVIGKAGFAFMEEVVRLALLAGGVSPETIASEDNKGCLYECIYQLEATFMDLSSRSKDDETVREFHDIFDGWDDLEEIYENHDVFAAVEFGEESIDGKGRKGRIKYEYDVDYGMIARAFNEIIRPVLEEKLKVIIDYMKTNGIEYGVNSDRFKIQRIGGFCNFYLVEQEINEIMGRAATREDKRYFGELTSSDDRTMAVAYGASLFANKRINYGMTWMHSLGVPVRTSIASSDTIPLWAVEEGAELVAGRVYLFKYENGNAALFRAKGIKKVVYKCSNEGNKEQNMSMLPKYSDRLKMNLNNYIIGVSQSRSEVLSFHWWVVFDDDEASKYLGVLEEMIASGEIKSVKCFGEEQRASLTKVFNLTGDEPIVRQV